MLSFALLRALCSVLCCVSVPYWILDSYFGRVDRGRVDNAARLRLRLRLIERVVWNEVKYVIPVCLRRLKYHVRWKMHNAGYSRKSHAWESNCHFKSSLSGLVLYWYSVLRGYVFTVHNSHLSLLWSPLSSWSRLISILATRQIIVWYWLVLSGVFRTPCSVERDAEQS